MDMIDTIVSRAPIEQRGKHYVAVASTGTKTYTGIGVDEASARKSLRFQLSNMYRGGKRKNAGRKTK